MKTKTYPEIGFLRLRDVIGDKKNPGIIPVSRSSWYKGIEEGRYPKPVKLGKGLRRRRREVHRKWPGSGRWGVAVGVRAIGRRFKSSRAYHP